jgi:hypothetical protein
MKFWRSGWFYVVALLFLCIISGLIWHKCTIDSLKDNNNKLLQQLLADSNYQTKRLDDTVSGIKTIQNDQMSADLLTEKLKEQLDKYNLEAVYGAQVQLQASVNKILDGSSGATQIIPRPTTPVTPQTTTIIVRDNHGPDTTVSNPSNPNIPSNTTPSGESVSVCNQCLSGNIIRVPFSADEQFLHIEGYTDSGAALGEAGTYHLEASWIKDIQLSIALTQAEDGTWETLIDSSDPDVQVSRIRSEINISPFEEHWYQRLQVGIGLGFGESGALLNGALGYKITDHWNLLGSWWFTMPFSGEMNSYSDNAYYGLILLGNL